MRSFRTSGFPLHWGSVEVREGPHDLPRCPASREEIVHPSGTLFDTLHPASCSCPRVVAGRPTPRGSNRPRAPLAGEPGLSRPVSETVRRRWPYPLLTPSPAILRPYRPACRPSRSILPPGATPGDRVC